MIEFQLQLMVFEGIAFMNPLQYVCIYTLYIYTLYIYIYCLAPKLYPTILQPHGL